ncbi:hypothetical protein TNIN_315351 [Trichonephila inaurata madagascariensis]|uniref:Uncharacterized protein n=1 Tax=Trichonephila inaurata madagascariensis TaxID=2747483 RepID=A0A8X6JC01_9ARAC|nr:hypothetical protein TNIN_315351 [Trichonephila inaurata madagascariensis]
MISEENEEKGEKIGEEASDASLMSEANEEKGEKIGKEASDTSSISKEDEGRSEETGNATLDPLSVLQSTFEEITLTLSGGKTTFSELIRQAMDENTHHDLAILVLFAKP